MNNTTTKIQWTKITNDINGNPRYVCHYNELLTEKDKEQFPLSVSPIFKVTDNISARYNIALTRAKKLGGKKFHNKQYGGGIVFQSYNIVDTERQINELLNVKK